DVGPGSARNWRGEDQREDREEVTARRRELDRDRPRLVVGDDPADVPVRRRVRRVGLRAGDVGVEADTLAGGEEPSLDRPLEIGREHLLAVRVLQALAQLEVVDL